MSSTVNTRRKTRSTVTTHHIGAWTLQESFEPFRQKENPSDKSDIHQWNVEQVCSFVGDVLGEDQYRSIIEEQLIDGFALVLLKDEHLTHVFHMPWKQRRRLLDQIKQIQI